MNGIIVVNKPSGMTSHDVVNKIRKILHTKKVGHTGTLDPLASGVLVICVNQATKIANFLESDDKVYECTVLLGRSTDTFDIEGKTIQEEKNIDITAEKIDEVLSQFIGEQEQVPPIYSAIKVDGKKLYQYAREGKEVKIEPRKIIIHSIVRCSDLIKKDEQILFKFKTHVSKGTYIRSLVHDIGNKLNIPCCMSKLIRLQSGVFKIEESNKIEEIEVGNYHLINMCNSITFEKINIHNVSAFSHLPRLRVKTSNSEKKI